MPQPDIPVDRRLKVGKSDLTQAAASNKGDEMKGLSSTTRATSTGPTVAKVEYTRTISTSPARVKANSSSNPSLDLNICSDATGTAANQACLLPQQSRGEGRNTVKKSLTFATPSRSKPTAPTPEDNLDRSRDTLGNGAQQPTEDTVTSPMQDSNISPAPTTEGFQAPPPRSATTHAPDGQIPDSTSAIKGSIALTNGGPPETDIMM